MNLFGITGLSALLLAGGGTMNEPEAGPQGIPYACEGGKTARIEYKNGGWFVRARASLAFDGRTIALQASPPTYGLRYVSADDNADPIMVWTARGEDAWLTELARDAAPDSPGREVAHCTRVRGESGATHSEGAAHSGESHSE